MYLDERKEVALVCAKILICLLCHPPGKNTKEHISCSSHTI